MLFIQIIAEIVQVDDILVRCSAVVFPFLLRIIITPIDTFSPLDSIGIEVFTHIRTMRPILTRHTTVAAAAATATAATGWLLHWRRGHITWNVQLMRNNYYITIRGGFYYL